MPPFLRTKTDFIALMAPLKGGSVGKRQSGFRINKSHQPQDSSGREIQDIPGAIIGQSAFSKVRAV